MSNLIISEACRVCLQTELCLSPIFDTENTADGVSFCEMILECTGHTAHQLDGFPQLMCHPCMENLQKAYSFRKLYQASHRTLVSLLDSKTVGTTEPIEACFEPVTFEIEELIIKTEDASDAEDGSNLDADSKPTTTNRETPYDPSRQSALTTFDENKAAQIKRELAKIKEEPTEESPDLLLNRDEPDFSEQKVTKSEQDVKEGKSCDEESFKCDDCDKTFRLYSLLTRHAVRHLSSEQRPHLCSECGKGFARNYELVAHMRTHTGERPFKCQYCDKRFMRPYGRRIHEGTHTGLKKHFCDICDKGFIRPCTLAIHKKTHSEEKPHLCPLCPSRFKQRIPLAAHINRHTGQKFHCNECDKFYWHHSYVKRHQVLTHGKSE